MVKTKEEKKVYMKVWHKKNPNYNRDYHIANAKKIKLRKRIYRGNNLDKMKAQDKANYERNKTKIIKRCRNWYKANPKKIKIHQKTYREKNEDKIKISQKHYRKKNSNKLRVQQDVWRRTNPKKIKIQRRKYYHQKLKSNPIFKFKNKIRHQTNKKYGLAKVCLICSSTENVEHHHYTEPYHEDYFVDSCKECHKGLEDGMGLISLGRLVW